MVLPKNLIQFPVEHQNVGELLPSFRLPPHPGRFFLSGKKRKMEELIHSTKGGRALVGVVN